MSFSFDFDDAPNDDIILHDDNLLSKDEIAQEIAKELTEDNELNVYPSDISFSCLLKDISSADYYQNKGYMSAKEDSLLIRDAISSLFGVQLPYSNNDFIVETRDKFILILHSKNVPSEIKLFDPMSQWLVFITTDMMKNWKLYGTVYDRLQGKPVVAFYYEDCEGIGGNVNVTRGDESISFSGYHFLGVFKADHIESSSSFALTKLWDRYWIPYNHGAPLQICVYDNTEV